MQYITVVEYSKVLGYITTLEYITVHQCLQFGIAKLCVSQDTNFRNLFNAILPQLLHNSSIVILVTAKSTCSRK